jgi:hypothetical protein
MEDPVWSQPFDGQNLLSFDLFDWNLAGSDRFLIEEDCTSPAECFSTAILGPRKGQISAKHPEKFTLPIYRESHGLSVQLEVDSFHYLFLLSVSPTIIVLRGGKNLPKNPSIGGMF